MGYSLRAGLSFCDTSGRLLFLDRRADRYFCLSRSAESAFRNLASGSADGSSDTAALERLIACNLLQSSAADVPPSPCPPPAGPRRSALESDHRPAAAAVGRALARLAVSSAVLKFGTLDRSLTRIERRKHKLRIPISSMLPIAGDIAAGFRQTGLLVPALDQCLPRSLALAHALLDARILPMLVIGARLNPFGAHCWVQAGDLLLNESLDEVRNFTPILVV